MFRLALSACLGLLLLPVASGAAPFTARYEVRAAGLTIMRVEASFDLGGAEYRMDARMRMVGLAGLVVGGEQVSRVEGSWQGERPVPRRFASEASWRGMRRLVEMEYGAGTGPMIRVLEPAADPGREPVPPAMRQGTTDSLSAVARLMRAVAATGRCDGEAATFDGLWRTDLVARTLGTESLPPREGFGGEALRCALEGRMVAGHLRHRDPRDARRPHPATAWLARVAPDAPPVPVRVDVPSRWFGFFRIVLVGLERGPPPPG